MELKEKPATTNTANSPVVQKVTVTGNLTAKEKPSAKKEATSTDSNKKTTHKQNANKENSSFQFEFNELDVHDPFAARNIAANPHLYPQDIAEAALDQEDVLN